MRYLSITAIALLMMACGSDAATAPTPSDTVDSMASDAHEDVAHHSDVDAATHQCPDDPLGPGDYEREVAAAGLVQKYRLHVPAANVGTEPAPLLLNIHGYFGDPVGHGNATEMADKAGARGFVVVHPEGFETSWNAGICCGDAADQNLDHVTALRAVVDDVADVLCIDRTRVFATGMSNGGAMSHRLGCEAADTFAAVAGVSGGLQIPVTDCQPSRPIPVLHIHGTDDGILPWEGGGIFGAQSVDDTTLAWTTANGCAPDSLAVTRDAAPLTCSSAASCSDGGAYTLCSIEQMGHCWPGEGGCTFDQPPGTPSATTLVLDFFEAAMEEAP